MERGGEDRIQHKKQEKAILAKFNTKLKKRVYRRAEKREGENQQTHTHTNRNEGARAGRQAGRLIDTENTRENT